MIDMPYEVGTGYKLAFQLILELILMIQIFKCFKL